MQNEIQLIADDNEAKAFLASHNRLQLMRTIPPFDRVSTVFETSEAWCLATFDEGHPNAVDNGYTVLVIPHGSMSPTEASQFIAEVNQAGRLHPNGAIMATVYNDAPEYH